MAWCAATLIRASFGRRGRAGPGTTVAEARQATTVGGRDVFVFRADSGHDLIEDFEQGKDRIDIRALGYRNIGQLDIESDGVGGSIVHFHDDNQVDVLNVASLTAHDFVFA
jgi:hypothetical protein